MFAPTRAARSAAGILLLVIAATPAAGQSHRTAVGVTGGWARYSDMTPGLTPTELSPGWTAGGQIEHWLGSGRLGIRLNGTYTSRPLESDPQQNYDIVMADAGLLLRILPAGDVRWVAPFVALGAGAALFRGESGDPLGGGSYGPDPVLRPLVAAGLGVDLLPHHRAGLRLEVADRVVLPSLGESPEAEGLPTVHNLAVTTAIQLRLGGIRDRVVRIAAPTPAAEARSAPSSRSSAESGRAAAGPIGVAAATAAATATANAGAEAAPPTSGDGVREDAAGPLFTVQVGEFVEPATAARWIARLKARRIPAWLVRTEVAGRTFTRVRVGALGSAADAEKLARALEQQNGWTVRVAPVEAHEPVPEGAVAGTRAFLYGS